MTQELLVVVLILVLIPGISVLYTIIAAITRGWTAGDATAFGYTLGIVPAVIAAFIGLSALIFSAAIAFIGLSALLFSGEIAYTVLKYTITAYLIYLAYQTWNDRGPISLSHKVPISYLKLASNGTPINVLNPKLSIFFLAFLPQLIDTSRAVQPQLTATSTTFMAMAFAVFLIYAAFAARAGSARLAFFDREL